MGLVQLDCAGECVRLSNHFENYSRRRIEASESSKEFGMRLPVVVHRAVEGALAVCAKSALLVVCLFATSVHAQDSLGRNSSSSQPAPATIPATSGQPANGAGGGMALSGMMDLMMLIQSTITPDEWVGIGTGTSTIYPWPNGVWLDAKGQMTRRERNAAMPDWKSGMVQAQWRAGAGLRTVSLKQLDAALGMMVARGLPPHAQMRQLAGITHIQFIAIDKVNRDILIAGPASKDVGDENGFLLEDLRTLAALMTNRTAPLGCSLDPNNQGILEAQKFLSDPGVIARLGRTPQVVADQLKAKVGPHSVNVFGIDPRSGTALALVDVDEHMKRVGLGLSNTVPKIKSYFEHLDRKGAAPAQSLIRWWFSYNNAAIDVNESGDLFQLPQQVVAVMSEQQWVNAQGTRQATGGVDEAADAFAAEMTEKLNDLRATQPAYARLQGIFELGLTLQLAIEATQQPSLAEWFPHLCYRSQETTAGRQAPTTVEGVTAWDRLRNGTVVAVISGGVMFEPAAIAGRIKSQTPTHISRPATLDIAQRSTATEWWWD